MNNEENLKAEIEKLKQENEALKKGKSKELYLKVSQKGALSLYGLGRFPVTLYKEQWQRLIDFVPSIKEAIDKYSDQLKVK